MKEVYGPAFQAVQGGFFSKYDLETETLLLQVHVVNSPLYVAGPHLQVLRTKRPLTEKQRIMRKLILEEWVSVDGYVADKNGQLDFFTQLTPEQNKYSDADQLKFLETIDTILLGRKTYELFVDFWPTATTEKEVIADKLNATKKLVFSNTITHAPWGDWAEPEIVSGDAVEAIRTLKLMAGKDMVIWGSISLAQSLMKEHLIDEYHIQLCPVLTGGGRGLFTEINPQQLNLIEVRPYNTGTVFLKYQTTKE